MGVRGANAVRNTSFTVSGPVNITSGLIADPVYTRSAALGNFGVQVNVFNIGPILNGVVAAGEDPVSIRKNRLIQYQISAFDPGAIPLEFLADGTTLVRSDAAPMA